MVAVDTDEKGIMKAGVLEELIKQDKEKVCVWLCNFNPLFTVNLKYILQCVLKVCNHYIESFS